MKKKLYSFNINNNDVLVQTYEEYDIFEHDELIDVVHSHGGSYNLSQNMYERIYGENLKTVVEKRREWLTYNVLPDRVKSLRKITDEIEILSNYLNNK